MVIDLEHGGELGIPDEWPWSSLIRLRRYEQINHGHNEMAFKCCFKTNISLLNHVASDVGATDCSPGLSASGPVEG
jgi:hypothetical protein